jgi:hypothetical protein
VQDAVNDNPSSSTHRIASQTGLSQSAVWHMLRENTLHPFHLQPVQRLQPGNKEHLEYCQWLLHRVVDEPNFLNRVLWTDEAGFTRDGVLNLHNLHVWAEENPNPTRSSSFQHRFSVNVWAGIVDDYLIGPYVIEDCIGGAQYLNFLQETLLILMDNLPLNVPQDMWYQLDGALAYFTRPVRAWLNHNYPGRWIGLGGPVTWPAFSSDFTPLHFFLWGGMKENVYATE